MTDRADEIAREIAKSTYLTCPDTNAEWDERDNLTRKIAAVLRSYRAEAEMALALIREPGEVPYGAERGP
jgi:hypothetical protein